jgi:hypothetical protein
MTKPTSTTAKTMAKIIAKDAKTVSRDVAKNVKTVSRAVAKNVKTVSRAVAKNVPVPAPAKRSGVASQVAPKLVTKSRFAYAGKRTTPSFQPKTRIKEDDMMLKRV